MLIESQIKQEVPHGVKVFFLNTPCSSLTATDLKEKINMLLATSISFGSLPANIPTPLSARSFKQCSWPSLKTSLHTFTTTIRNDPITSGHGLQTSDCMLIILLTKNDLQDTI